MEQKSITYLVQAEYNEPHAVLLLLPIFLSPADLWDSERTA